MRAVMVGMLLMASNVVIAKPGGQTIPPSWMDGCAERLARAQVLVGKRVQAVATQPKMSLRAVNEQTFDVRLDVSRDVDYVVHVSLIAADPSMPEAEDFQWRDRLLDTKRPQRLLMLHAHKNGHGLVAEIALTPDAPSADYFVKTFQKAIDACVAELKK